LGVVYPAANLAAVVVLALEGAGLVVVGRALGSVVRQARLQRALARSLSEGCVRRADFALGIVGTRPTALCAGLPRPRLYVTTAALEILSPTELEAVLAHEAHHRRRRDPLRLAVAQVLADALYFLPAVRRLAEHHALLTEIDADAAAVAGTDGSALA